MKILLVNKFLYPSGGDYTYLKSLASLLSEKKHEIIYWGMKDSKNEIIENQDFFVDNIDYDKINKTKTIRNSIQVLTKSIYSYEASSKIKGMKQKWREIK